MDWDHLLLKKYSSTSHFRLIKQLKSELQPSYKQSKSKHKISQPVVVKEKVPFSELNFN